MATHERLKNEFTENEKYHNLITWQIWPFPIKDLPKITFRTNVPDTVHQESITSAFGSEEDF